MGKIEDEKYTSREDRDSQVRNIINQLNADRPSSEKSREVVVRADGTKAIRVVKKRKVMVSNDEKARRARRSFVYGLLILFLLVGALVGLIAFRMSRLASDDYFRELEMSMCEALGAENVRLTGGRLDGLTLKASSIVIEFEGEGMVAHAEMSDISGVLATSSFFTGVLKFDEVKMARAGVTLRDGVQKLDIPAWQGEQLWDISRVVCDDFLCRMGEGDKAPFMVEHASAYMYFPAKSKDSRVLIMNGGRLHLRGWKPMELMDGRVQISTMALENIRMRATTEIMREKGKKADSYLEISGSLAQGDALDKPLQADTDNMNFADFSQGRFSHFFTASTVAASVGRNKPTFTVSLPFVAERPVFSGLFGLKNIRLTSLPAVLAIIEHIEPTKRRPYMPPTIKKGRVSLAHEGENISISFTDEDMREPDLMSLSGKMIVGADNALSGNLTYGIPAGLTHVEYPDGAADPIFRDDGVMAWVNTTLSGVANAPTDNSDELDRQAAAQRAERPARTPFENIDIDALSDKYLGSSHSVSGDTNAATEAAEEAAGEKQAPAQPNNSGNPFLPRKNTNPFDTPDPFNNKPADPFSPSGSLTQPVDSSVFPSL